MFKRNSTVQFIFKLLAYFGVVSTLYADQSNSAKPAAGFIADRLALIMTGSNASDAQIAAFEGGTKSIVELADELKLHPKFEDRLAQYWTEEIGITKRTNWWEIYTFANILNENSAKTTIEDYYLSFRNQNGIFLAVNGSGGYQSACNQAKYNNSNIQTGLVYSLSYPSGDEATRKRLLFSRDPGFCNCEDAQWPTNVNRPVPINAWFAPPGKQILVCPGLVDACGVNAEKCLPTDSSSFYGLIAQALAMEPGYIAAKTIVENKPWDHVLTTKNGVANAALLNFLGRPDVAQRFKQNSGPNNFSDIAANPHLPAARADMHGNLLLQNTGSEFAWVNRGPNHAGALTTAAFMLNFNGHRAYADASRRIFLCREFTVPEGVEQVTSDIEDLTLKPYCSECHRVLEPLSEFWRRWPSVGADNFIYFAHKTASGSFAGQTGSDVTALANIYTQTTDFSTCAVKHAFKFVTGRPMTEAEEGTILQPLHEVFLNNNRTIWPVMRKIIAGMAGQE